MRAQQAITVLALAAACGRPDGARSAGPPSVRYDAHVSAGGLVPPAGTMANPFAGDARSVSSRAPG